MDIGKEISAGPRQMAQGMVGAKPLKKLVLKCGLSPGDIVMLTAAVRDLHRCHPQEFITDVRTSCAELWANNPYITPLADDDAMAQRIDCTYPLINRSNTAPYHCLHGFVEFLNDQLGLKIRPTRFHGDIHLSELEKSWYSQVYEVTGADIPFWIIAAGGKYDVSIKWWSSERYQEVVDYFRGKIQFVQVGERGHHHPKLDGVIDLRGKTNMRELVRLVYHAQGVLCSVTALMHLAAAVETKAGQPKNRPCVVVAGGREPAHWEAYPAHQFIHRNGALRCGVSGGCWKDRMAPLRDGDSRDELSHRCVDVVKGLPHCMHLITADEVIQRIETYFRGGALSYLPAKLKAAADRGVAATATNNYDQQPLNLHSAGMACDAFIKKIPAYPADQYQGRGIVICAGGMQYFTNAWVCINFLRRLGCQLPIQVWHLDQNELDESMAALLKPLGVTCVDASEVRKKNPARILRGWPLKAYAILHSPFREVLYLDADNVPVVNPEFLFDTPEFKDTGAIFWPDYDQPRNAKKRAIWRSIGVPYPREPEFESGQIVVEKQRCWEALCLTMWLNEHSDFYYQYVHGDKETFHLAFRKLKQSLALVPQPIHPLYGTMCQHDFSGRRIFQHRNLDKWDFLQRNRQVKDFWFEAEGRRYVSQLRKRWDGRMGHMIKKGLVPAKPPKFGKAAPVIDALIISTAEAAAVASKTTRDNLGKTDWKGAVISVTIGDHEINQATESDAIRRALQVWLKGKADYLLLLEHDLDFNRRLWSNLRRWAPLRSRTAKLACLYNPKVRELACDAKSPARLVDPNVAFAANALLISRDLIPALVRHWRKGLGTPSARAVKLLGKRSKLIFYHSPSLVQRVGNPNQAYYPAVDFDRHW